MQNGAPGGRAADEDPAVRLDQHGTHAVRAAGVVDRDRALVAEAEVERPVAGEPVDAADRALPLAHQHELAVGSERDGADGFAGERELAPGAKGQITLGRGRRRNRRRQEEHGKRAEESFHPSTEPGRARADNPDAPLSFGLRAP